jgi:CRISPR-associated exonuclease Cas4
MALEPISASALERFGYCPLSWWLALRSEVTSKELEEGEKEHSAIANDLVDIMAKEKIARGWERLVLAFSLVATILAVIGITLLSNDNGQQISVVLGTISIVWIAAALLLLFRSASVKDRKQRSKAQQIVAGFAIVAMVIALNAMTILNVNPELAIVLEIIALLWLIAASLALYVSIQNGRKAREIRERRAIQGEIKYVDDGKPRMLRSDRLGLQGRPDYILEVEGEMVPVELKSGRTPKGPLFSHILQLAAYSVLLEDEGEKVTHGILRYEEAEHEIEYNQDLRRMVVTKLDEMRVLMKNGEVHRNHHRPGKCRSCSRREGCPERLT